MPASGGKNISYFDILKQAALLTWKNRFLWFFGFLIMLGSMGSNFNTGNNESTQQNLNMQFLPDMFKDSPALFIAVIIVVVVVGIILFLLRIVATAGIIKSVNDIKLYSQLSIGAILRESKKYLGRLLLLEILVGLVLAVIAVVLAVPVVYLFAIKVKFLAWAIMAVAIMIILPLIVLAYFLLKYASFLIVLVDEKIRMSLELAYAIFLKNIKESFLMGIFLIVTSLLLTMILAAALFVAVVVFAPFGLIAYWAFAKMGAIIVAIVAVLFLVVALTMIMSWYYAFLNAAWLLFFQQIAFQKQDDKNMLEEKEVEGKLPTPEVV